LKFKEAALLKKKLVEAETLYSIKTPSTSN
jgi:hypothetical protein